jgi:hypothetical protein
VAREGTIFGCASWGEMMEKLAVFQNLSFVLIFGIALFAGFSALLDHQASATRKWTTCVGAILAAFAGWYSADQQDHADADRRAFQATNLKLTGQVIEQSKTIERLSTGGDSKARFDIELLYDFTDGQGGGFTGPVWDGQRTYPNKTVADAHARFRLTLFGPGDDPPTASPRRYVYHDPLRSLYAWLTIARIEPGMRNRVGIGVYEREFPTFSYTGASLDMRRISSPYRLTGDRTLFEGHFTALNGSWNQIIRMRRVGQWWEWRSTVFRFTKYPEVHVGWDEVTPNYPSDERNRPIVPISDDDLRQPSRPD